MHTLRRHHPLVLSSLLFLASCSPPPEEVAPSEPATGVRLPLPSDRGGIGVQPRAMQPYPDPDDDFPFPDDPPPRVQQTPVPPLNHRRSLAVTETAITQRFTLQAVLNQLASQNGTGGLTGTQLFRQLWDTQSPTVTQSDLPAGPRCSDNGNTLNGFPYPCRTSEGQQALPSSITNISSYSAVGLFNRFDMAPVDGATCGEYRIVFAKTSGGSGRNFIIFEAVLPNPRTDLGLEGCRPVVNFWRDLSANGDVTSRGTLLSDFYFKGLPGFSPVVHYANYGANSGATGQVRVNMFIQPTWLLREFKTARTCTATGCMLKFIPVTVKANPFGGLFSAGSTHPLASEFQTTFFPSQVASLAQGNVNTFNYMVMDKFNAGESNPLDPGPDDFVTQFTGNSTLRARIQTALTAMGSTLTPDNIVARAQALSCGGCHRRSNGAALGGFTFPVSTGFVHSTELPEQDPEGPTGSQRFQLSTALTGTFLPHRAQVMDTFLRKPADNAVFISQSVPTVVSVGQTFTVAVTMKNTGTTVWSSANSFALMAQNTNWGVSSVALAATDAIAEGQQKTFSFSVRAPSVAGAYAFQWRMKRGTAAFGDATSTVQVTVQCLSCPPPDPDPGFPY